MTDWILIKDNVFSDQECDEIINTHKENCVFEKDYKYYSCTDIDINSFKYDYKINYLLDEYVKEYEESGKTASIWSLTTMRFKHFKPGESFYNWHSENSMTYPHRVLALQIYLSNHNCGTEFSAYDKTVLSVKGRATMFPAYFTHTHRGQVCPENKDRYLLTGYVNFIRKGELE
jgi:hypothetical protein